MKYIVSVFEVDAVGNELDARWYEVETTSAERARRAVIENILDGREAGFDVSAFLTPDKPIVIERLADMSEFEAEFRELGE